MSSPDQFSLRDATLVQDEAFIISVFDASLPFLESVGSQAQWGSTPFSHRPGWDTETQTQIQESEQNAASNTTDALRILILEVEVTQHAIKAIDTKNVHMRTTEDGYCHVAVGFAFVRGNWLPKYLPEVAVEQAGHVPREESLYVEVMVSDSRVKDRFRGVGATLLREVRQWGRSREKKVLYLDGWAGNERKLIRYYEKHGFRVVANFSLARKNKEPWNGTLLSTDI